MKLGHCFLSEIEPHKKIRYIKETIYKSLSGGWYGITEGRNNWNISENNEKKVGGIAYTKFKCEHYT